jgi:hypothetical protein
MTKRALFALFAATLLLSGLGCRNRECRNAERYPVEYGR